MSTPVISTPGLPARKPRPCAGEQNGPFVQRRSRPCAPLSPRPPSRFTTSSGPRRQLQRRQPRQGLRSISPAHLLTRAQAHAHRRPLRPSKQRTPQIWQQLHAVHPRRLSVRHPRNGRRNARGDTTRRTPRPTLQRHAHRSTRAQVRAVSCTSTRTTEGSAGMSRSKIHAPRFSAVL
jgi:hypothetical protein